MKKRVLALCLASFFSVNAFALVPPGNDVTTKPDLYYLTNAQAIDSLALLPPPPADGGFIGSTLLGSQAKATLPGVQRFTSTLVMKDVVGDRPYPTH